MKPIESQEDHDVGEAERVAAEWVLRQAQGLTAEDEQKFAQWLASDARHDKIYQEMLETSHLLDGLKFRLAHLAGPKPARKDSPEKRRRWPLAALAAVAVLVLGVFVFQFSGRKPVDYAGAATTALGEFRRVDLPDGSSILMNTNTAVEVSYDHTERRVRLLSGEAYFQVAKNPERPFIVQAGRIAVRAVGTAFNVRLRTEALSVLVTEGKVSVNGSGAGPTTPDLKAGDLGPVLSVGHMARVTLDTDWAPTSEGMVVTSVEAQAIKNALAWQEGRLVFLETPLAEVVAEFNRYNRQKIVIADAKLASRRFGGAFAAQQIEPFLELLEQNFDVVTETRGNETIIRQGK